MTLVEKHRLQRFEARVLMIFGTIVSPWVQHIRLGRELIRRAFRVAHERGDLNFSAYSANYLALNLLLCGDPLAEVQRETAISLDYCRKAQVRPATDTMASQLRLVESLRGTSRGPGHLDESLLDESRFHPDVKPKPLISAYMYWQYKLQLHFFRERLRWGSGSRNPRRTASVDLAVIRTVVRAAVLRGHDAGRLL